ncbi:hypothetical protein ACWGH3_38760 [Streptomyces sp. NPDC054884]|uniref:hypothetical protein n=1 Tax=Streptomyces sp. ME08-AFT2 TaxID=3028683 RepID=UPI0029B553DC|nr:hypothetical protein [Streptomyces sp. ME08-AFT2]MDX3310595.1 hypothetical protein [Streptomyces sp. ME08-AFT2]
MGTGVAVSAKYVAWVEYNPSPDARLDATVAVTDRSTGTGQNIPVGKVRSKGVKLGLRDNWVVYGATGALNADDSYSSDALTVYDLTSGATRKLLDHLISAATAPDGTLFARGGTVAGNEGVYRIAPGQHAPRRTRHRTHVYGSEPGKAIATARHETTSKWCSVQCR